MKLFGKNLFGFKKEPTLMYDFAQHGILDRPYGGFDGILSVATEAGMDTPIKKSKKKVVVKPNITPKELYKLESLNNNDFSVQASPEYIEQQLEMINQKLAFLGPKPKEKKSKFGRDLVPQTFEIGGVKYGRDELESVKERIENRRRIGEFKNILEKYPHTSSQKIQEVVTEHSNLRCQPVGNFVPDLPSEAISAMKEYDKMCVELCNKKTHYYVIADNKDFHQVAKRRDPILLAESPFGHFWQILGAWDEEMIYLGDL